MEPCSGTLVEKELPMASWTDLDTARSVIRGLNAEDRVHRRARCSCFGNPQERWKTAFRIACSTFPSASYRHPTGRLWSTLMQQIGRGVRINQQGYGRVFDFYLMYNKYLYNHSRARLRSVVQIGYKTRVVFQDGKQIDGDRFVASRFKRPIKR